MVEGARLESVYTRKGIAGSNPALSANPINARPTKEGIFVLKDFAECPTRAKSFQTKIE